MGKKVYSSGISASDLADERPRNQGTNMAQMSGRVSAPPIDDGTRAQAMVFTHKTGNRDMWEALGLDEYADQRRRALGLLTGAEAAEPSCPDCESGPGESCKSERGRKLGQWHIARKRLARRIRNIEGDQL
jgi:hypothetical protein